MAGKLSLGLKAVAIVFAAAASSQALAAPSCESVASIALPHVTITGAQRVMAGAFKAPPGSGGPPNEAQLYRSLPEFCRIEATLRPSADSDIRAEIWIPARGWNGRFQMRGNGAYMGTIGYGGLAMGVTQGYAMAASNTGHTNDHNEDFWIGHPEKMRDWQVRAVHETAVTAKAVIAFLFGSGPRYSYWNACSTGGRQGWMEAEYYPGDFDGLAIGDPANPMTRLQAGSIWANLAVNRTLDSFIPPAKWAMIHDAVLADCDAKDGLKDGLIENIAACGYKPARLLCKAADAADCLTRAQLIAVEAVMAGPHDPKTGASIYPGYPLGIRMMPGPVVGKAPDTSAPTTFRMLFGDPSWDYHNFDFDRDIVRSDRLGYQTMNAVNPEKLGALFARGGKILLYHGWEDPAITPLIHIKLYEEAVRANGGLANTYDKIRLFMVPGKSHCSVDIDQMAAITAWVEQGKAPDMMTTSYTAPGAPRDAPPVRTRIVCPYPLESRYKGKGSIDEAANFACRKVKS